MDLQEFYTSESEKCFTNDDMYSNFSLRGKKYHARKRQETAKQQADAERQASEQRKAEADAMKKIADDKKAKAEAELKDAQDKLDEAKAKEDKAKEEQKKAEVKQVEATTTNKTDYTKIAMIGGGSLVAIVLIALLLKK